MFEVKPTKISTTNISRPAPLLDMEGVARHGRCGSNHKYKTHELNNHEAVDEGSVVVEPSYLLC